MLLNANFNRGVNMTRTLHLIKVIIRNFRSIKELHKLNNIGDVTVFVGANESGKSNILKALSWFGNDKPLGDNDKPVEFWAVNVDDLGEPIVEAYFEIIDKERFNNNVISKVIEICDITKSNVDGEDILKNDKTILNNVQFLKFEKYANGSFKSHTYDSQLKDITHTYINLFRKHITNPLNLFAKIYEDTLLEELKLKNIPENQLTNAVGNIKNDVNFNTNYQKIANEITNSDIFETDGEICRKIKNIIKNIPNNIVNISIPGRQIPLNPRNIFVKTITKFNTMSNIFTNLIPKFVYLDEEMELKGTIRKGNTSWSNTLKEDNNNHPINSRFFKILNVNLREFDKKTEEEQDIILENKSYEFSKILKKSWKKNVGIKMDLIPGNKISFKIIEYDEKNEPISGKTTFPEERSKGFKWYLAYFITLEYLKALKERERKDVILLLDDPAVYLHPDAQKSFLEKVEELSKEYQILYNTHLMSLFSETELDRVLLVKHGIGNRTEVKKPWGNNQKDIIQPIRHALGFDKILFEENLEKVLFVEGISDKFILEGLQKSNSTSNGYIQVLNGGKDLNKISKSKKIELIFALMDYLKYVHKMRECDYYIILDGDMKNEYESSSKIDEKLKSKIRYMGDSDQEIEDLIDKDFYLNCVLETYKAILINELEKFKKVEGIVEKLRKTYNGHLITKKLDEEFKSEGLNNFSKVETAITIKRKLYKNPEFSNKFMKIIEYLNK